MEVTGVPREVDYRKVRDFINISQKASHLDNKITPGKSSETANKTLVVENGHTGRHIDVYA